MSKKTGRPSLYLPPLVQGGRPRCYICHEGFAKGHGHRHMKEKHGVIWSQRNGLVLQLPEAVPTTTIMQEFDGGMQNDDAVINAEDNNLSMMLWSPNGYQDVHDAGHNEIQHNNNMDPLENNDVLSMGVNNQNLELMPYPNQFGTTANEDAEMDNEPKEPNVDNNNAMNPPVQYLTSVAVYCCPSYAELTPKQFSSNLLEVEVLRPSMEDMKNYSIPDYVTKIAEKVEVVIKKTISVGIHKRAGLFKIIPEDKYSARSDNYVNLDKQIVLPKNQCFDLVGEGVYRLHQDNYRNMTVAEFKEKSKIWAIPPGPDVNLEDLFWEPDRLTSQRTLYGSDVVNSKGLFTNKLWDLGELKSMLKHAEEQKDGEPILGITSSYVYFGSWGSAFTLHKENMDTLSINYLHCGADKVWYFIHPEDKLKFEVLLRDSYPDEYFNCPNAYRHKNFMVSPELLVKRGIRYGRLVQHAGEFVVAFNNEFHWGWNKGFNCSEAINFGTERWLKESLEEEIQLCSANCNLRHGDLTWDMDIFNKSVKAKQARKAKEAQQANSKKIKPNNEHYDPPYESPKSLKRKNESNDNDKPSKRRYGPTNVIR